jgi:hypothetical protein
MTNFDDGFMVEHTPKSILGRFFIFYLMVQ